MTTGNRSPLLKVMALMKKHIEEAIERIFPTLTLKTKITSEKTFFNYLGMLKKNTDSLVSLVNKIEPQNKEQAQVLLSELQKLPKELEKLTFSIKLTEKEDFGKNLQEITQKLENLAKILQKQQEFAENSSKKSNISSILQEIKQYIQQFKVVIPKQFKVEVTNQPIFSTEDIVKQLKQVEKSIANIKIPEQKQITLPQIPKTLSIQEGKKIVEVMQNVLKEIQKIQKTTPPIEFPESIRVSNFPPQKVPIPPTNININPLRGYAKASQVTVTTSRIGLPTEILTYRRGVLVYNNGSNTVYIGGANVEASDGLPIPPGQYSPTIDAGERMLIYGITLSGQTDVRVLEVSNESIGNE